MPNRLTHALEHSKSLANQRDNLPSRHGFIYIIGVHDFVKVGIAYNVKVRITNLQVGCPYELKLLASWATENARRDERRMHALWKKHEVRGEWFKVPIGELYAAINAETIDAVFI